MYLAIDNRQLIRQPHTIEIVQDEHVVERTAARRPLVTPGSGYAQINCTFGRTLTYQAVMSELHRVRADKGIHAITFEPIRGGRYLTVNAFMGEPRLNHAGYDICGRIVHNSFTVPFIQVDPPMWLYPMEFILSGIIDVTSPYTFHAPPAAGEFFAIEGFIADLGAGGGQTRIQIRNESRGINYLATEGDFVCAAPPDKTLQNAVLASDLEYYGGDDIYCNVTQIPGAGMSADAKVTFWSWMHEP